MFEQTYLLDQHVNAESRCLEEGLYNELVGKGKNGVYDYRDFGVADAQQYLYLDDKEDGSMSRVPTPELTLDILDFDEAYAQLKEVGNLTDHHTPDKEGVTVMYRLTDNVGNHTYYTSMVYVTSESDMRSKDKYHADYMLDKIANGESDTDWYTAWYNDNQRQDPYIRFVDEWNYKKNPYWDKFLTTQDTHYTDDEFLSAWKAYQHGALQPYSKWYTDPGCVKMISDGFELMRTARGLDAYEKYETEGAGSYTFSRRDCVTAKEYIASNGIGNSRSDDGLSGFILQYMEPNETDAPITVRYAGSETLYKNSVANSWHTALYHVYPLYTMDYSYNAIANDTWGMTNAKDNMKRYTITERNGRLEATLSEIIDVSDAANYAIPKEEYDKVKPYVSLEWEQTSKNN